MDKEIRMILENQEVILNALNSNKRIGESERRELWRQRNKTQELLNPDNEKDCCNMEKDKELNCEGCNKVSKDLNPCEHCGFQNLGFPFVEKKDASCEDGEKE